MATSLETKLSKLGFTAIGFTYHGQVGGQLPWTCNATAAGNSYSASGRTLEQSLVETVRLVNPTV
jgi:hypothetical protein